MGRARVAMGIGLLLVVAVACGEGAASPTGDGTSAKVTVLAAASLSAPFEEIADDFEASHPGVDVALGFDGSAALATAIVEGAPADVFASADVANLDKVAAAGLVEGEPVPFATNRLEIVVAAGNPLGIRTLADLGGDVVVALCAPEVPCGAYAALAFQRAGLPVPAAGRVQSVKAVVSRVQLGEADAGLVYVTDVRAATGVEGVELPEGQAVQATYPAAVVTSHDSDASRPSDGAAAAFLAYLTSPDAQAVLAAHGFGPAPT